MEKITFTKETRDYFDHLVFLLFFEGYFSYLQNAQKYVDKIIDFIVNDLHAVPHKEAPFSLMHMGTYYIFYSPNKRTTWYIFFENRKSEYLITGILNNHCPEARFLGE